MSFFYKELFWCLVLFVWSDPDDEHFRLGDGAGLDLDGRVITRRDFDLEDYLAALLLHDKHVKVQIQRDGERCDLDLLWLLGRLFLLGILASNAHDAREQKSNRSRTKNWGSLFIIIIMIIGK